MNRIEIDGWDHYGPETDDNVASFTIRDPQNPNDRKRSYCIGYKFNGGDLQNPENWSYDHTNYWRHDLDVEDPARIQLVSELHIRQTLEMYGIEPEDLLIQYCEKLKDLQNMF